MLSLTGHTWNVDTFNTCCREEEKKKLKKCAASSFLPLKAPPPRILTEKGRNKWILFGILWRNRASPCTDDGWRHDQLTVVMARMNEWLNSGIFINIFSEKHKSSHKNNGMAAIWYFRDLMETLCEANWFETAASTNAHNPLFLVFALMIQKIRQRNWVLTRKSWLRSVL